MKYKIVVDSCCDLTEDYKQDEHFQIIPLTLQVDEHDLIDDDSFDQRAYLKLVRESIGCPKTACPSPDQFKAAYECDVDAVFVVTLSSHLSGTYNSAVLAKNLYLEEHGADKQIEVFSSDSASVGEVLIALKIHELAGAGKTFDEVVEQVSAFRDRMNTYFVLETLDFLKKNGRLTGLQAVFATALNIKPVMGGDSGTIIKKTQARGMNKALAKMADLVVADASDTEAKILAIAHCNCPQRAELVRDMICSRIKVRDVYITDTYGVSSTYAGDGGIIVTL